MVTPGFSLPPTHPLARFASADPGRLGGEPVFRGTRVPIRSLFEHLKAGDSLDAFLGDFPGITREQAEAVLEIAEKALLQSAGAK